MKNYILISLLILIGLFNSSCSDDVKTNPLEVSEEEEMPEVIVNDLENPQSVTETELGTAEFFNAQLVNGGYILVNDAGANRVYLMDKRANVVFEWDFDGKDLGNDAFLLSNGKLLAMIESDEPQIKFGGQAGVVQILSQNGTSE